jgi:hypothetical protein
MLAAYATEIAARRLINLLNGEGIRATLVQQAVRPETPFTVEIATSNTIMRRKAVIIARAYTAGIVQGASGE